MCGPHEGFLPPARFSRPCATLASVLVAYTLVATALGNIGLLWGDDGILAIALPAQTDKATIRHLATLEPRRRGAPSTSTEVLLEHAPPAVREAADRLVAHLAGDAGAAADLSCIALDERRLTPFRRRVYAEARRIPRGELVSYAELARRSGAVHGARAVGRAMATNPWPIVVPCHRVVSADGALHGFSAPGGTRTKASLLAIEGLVPNRTRPSEARARDADAQGSLPFRPTR